MNIRERLFLIVGSNFSQRQQTLKAIKKRLLKDASSSLATFTFYANEIDLKGLSGKLLSVSFGQKRVLVVKNFHQLKSPVRKFLFKNIKKILSANCLIFDTDKEFYQLQRDKKFMSDDLFALVLRGAAIYRVSSLKREFSIQDFISSLRKNDLKASLYVVESLFAAGTKDSILGPQIIGILVQSCSRFSHWRRKECLEYLWEADRALKERGIDSRLVVETVLTKIFSKQAG